MNTDIYNNRTPGLYEAVLHVRHTVDFSLVHLRLLCLFLYFLHCLFYVCVILI